jgi:hypothetical protein
MLKSVRRSTELHLNKPGMAGRSGASYGGFMRIGKPLLLVLTPIGVVSGLYEAWQFSPGLAFLMIALLTVVAAGVGTIVGTIRAEQARERERLSDPEV